MKKSCSMLLVSVAMLLCMSVRAEVKPVDFEKTRQTIEQDFKKRASIQLSHMVTNVMNLHGIVDLQDCEFTELWAEDGGVLVNCLVKKSIFSKQNLIATKLTCNETATLGGSFYSFKQSKLGAIKLINTGQETAYIELIDTQVAKDITFEGTAGIVRIDQKSKVAGKVINGKLLKK